MVRSSLLCITVPYLLPLRFYRNLTLVRDDGLNKLFLPRGGVGLDVKYRRCSARQGEGSGEQDMLMNLILSVIIDLLSLGLEP